MTLIRMSEVPEIRVHIIDSTEKIGGIGEPGVPPTAPAVANAVFAGHRRPSQTDSHDARKGTQSHAIRLDPEHPRSGWKSGRGFRHHPVKPG